MKLTVASDHRGYSAKRRLVAALRDAGHEVKDFGCHGTTNSDFPDFAIPAARAVADGTHEIGILLDGIGIGMSVAANKVPGIRAGLVHDELTARRAREHNHCNVLCLGADLLNDDEIRRIVEIFMTTAFEGGRHARRMKKVSQYEQEILGVRSGDF